MKIPLFDIDWTLIKGGIDIKANGFDIAIREVSGLQDASVFEIVLHGKTDPLIIKEVLELHSIPENEIKEMLPKALKILENYFLKHQDKLRYQLLPGAKEILKDLKSKDIPIGVLTGNLENIGWKKLEKSGIKEYFDFGAFSDSIINRIDLIPLAVESAKKYLKKEVSLGNFIIIGDSPLDVKCAKDAGVQIIAVAAGEYSTDELQKAGADLVLNSLEEKEEFIEFIS